jgi:hypothetical protein
LKAIQICNLLILFKYSIFLYKYHINLTTIYVHYRGGMMADDSMKDMMQRLRKISMSEALDPDATDMMGSSDILGREADDNIAREAAEAKFGKTISKADFQDNVAKNKALRGKELMDKALSRGKTTRWLPSIEDAGDTTKEVKRNILKKLGSKAGGSMLKRAAGLAIGGPLMLASEAADAAESGPAEGSIDSIIEGTEYTPEQKQRLKAGHDTGKRIREDKGYMDDVKSMRDKVNSIIAKDNEADQANLTEDTATDRAMQKIDPREQMKILKQMRDANRRK